MQKSKSTKTTTKPKKNLKLQATTKSRKAAKPVEVATTKTKRLMLRAATIAFAAVVATGLMYHSGFQSDGKAAAAGGTWLSGTSGGAADGSFERWRGEPAGVAGTWFDSNIGQVEQWSITPPFEFANWSKPIDVAIGAIDKSKGESWAAAANGAYDGRWQQVARNFKKNWTDKGKPEQNLMIRFAHEMNGSWYPWNVKPEEAADFKKAYIRFVGIKNTTIPKAKMVFNVNKNSSGGQAGPRQLWPGKQYADIYSVDFYNTWPWCQTSSCLDTQFVRREADGNPFGLEAHRQDALNYGVPLAISEWSNNGDRNDAGGGGESPEFMTYINTWMRKNAGTGSGQLYYDIIFNLWPQYSIFGPEAKQPQTAERYRSLTWGGATSATLPSTPAPAPQPTPTPKPTPTPEPTIPPVVPRPAATKVSLPLRINSGGPAYTDPSGIAWQADSYWAGDPIKGNGGVTNIASAITGTTASALYQTERWGLKSYQFPINNGTYDVKLHFAEINPASGARSFNVSAEGQPILTKYVINADAGGNYKAVIKTFRVAVNDGSLDLEFKTLSNASSVAAVEVLSTATPVPLAPGNFAGIATAPTSVTLRWTKPSLLTNLTKYVIQRDDKVVAELPIQTTQYVDAVSAGSVHTYTIRSVNAAGAVSNPSNVVTVATPSPVDTAAPSAPAGLRAEAVSPKQVNITWQPATDNINVANYIVMRDGRMVATVPGNVHSYGESNLSPETSFRYAVIAVDAAGNRSASSGDALVTTARSAGISSVNGLAASYFTSKDLSGTPIKRIDRTVNFDWGNNAPISGLPIDNFSVRWSGYLMASKAGEYTISTGTDDGIRVYLNGKKVIDNWTRHAYTVNSTVIKLKANSANKISIEYNDVANAATAKLFWQEPGKSSMSTVPARALMTERQGLTAAYFNNSQLKDQPVLTRVDDTVNFDWGQGSPASSLRADNFSVRWSGYLMASKAGEYTISTGTDDGIRVYLNGKKVIDNWTRHAYTKNKATVTLKANSANEIKVEYNELVGSAAMKLFWTGPDIPTSIIPQNALRSE